MNGGIKVLYDVYLYRRSIKTFTNHCILNYFNPEGIW